MTGLRLFRVSECTVTGMILVPSRAGSLLKIFNYCANKKLECCPRKPARGDAGPAEIELDRRRYGQSLVRRVGPQCHGVPLGICWQCADFAAQKLRTARVNAAGRVTCRSWQAVPVQVPAGFGPLQ